MTALSTSIDGIFLNVYDLVGGEKKLQSLSRDGLTLIGLGVFHSGLQVGGVEWSFGGDASGRNDPSTDGVFSVVPGAGVIGSFKVQCRLGDTPAALQGEGGREAFEAIIDRMRPEWRAASYHILHHNCNHFTRALAAAIEPALAAQIPDWVNRLASAGGVVVPDALVRSITDAVSPPAACAPDLINHINVPLSDAFAALPQMAAQPLAQAGCEIEADPPKTSSLLSGLSRAAKSAGAAVTSAVKGAIVSIVDGHDTRHFAQVFPEIDATLLVSAYMVSLLHVNRTQRAKLFICKKEGLFFAGDNHLKRHVPFSHIVGYCFATADVPSARAAGNSLPTFTPTNGTGPAVVLYCREEAASPSSAITMIPLYDFSFCGRAVTAIPFSQTGPLDQRENVATNAGGYIDRCIREFKETL